MSDPAIRTTVGGSSEACLLRAGDGRKGASGPDACVGYAVPMNPETLKSTASAAQRSRTFRTLARVGYVVLGIVHIIIGAIAISVAVGAGGGEADQGGAMEQISRVPFGTVVLWVIVLGLAALGVWQIVEAFLEHDPDTKKKWGRRVKEVGTALAYFAIGAHGARLRPRRHVRLVASRRRASARSCSRPRAASCCSCCSGSSSSASASRSSSRGIRRDFEKQLSLPAGKAGDGIRMLGVVGYIAKGVAIAVVGVLFVVAAFTHDPEKAGGLDAALKSLAALPFGQVILWLVGAGLVVYGVYCFARARYARL